MNSISEKTMQKLKNKVQNGTKMIFVEGPADVNVYKRIYPDAKIKSWGSCDEIIELITNFNKTMGKTPLIAGIIDKDLKTHEEIKALAEENIFVLGEREIESVFLREDVIQILFGEQFFQKFASEICNNASNRIGTEITNYDQALSVLKKAVSSKFNIRLLLKTAGKKNKGNSNNIDLLCTMMDEKDAWDSVKCIFPDIYGNFPENKANASKSEKFREQLRNFKPSTNFDNTFIEENEKMQQQERDFLSDK